MAQENVKLAILGQYLRDLSFEKVNNVKDPLSSQVDVNVAIGKSKEDNNVYESALKVRVTAKKEDKIAFIMDIDYVAEVKIEHSNENVVKSILLTEIPRLIFPYVRQIIANISIQGGFSALNLSPIDFNLLKN